MENKKRSIHNSLRLLITPILTRIKRLNKTFFHSPKRYGNDGFKIQEITNALTIYKTMAMTPPNEAIFNLKRA
jgi:hypothetical protein